MPKSHGAYIKELRRRAKESHIYRKYQLLGLEISQILKDEKHKALYIKLAKERNGDRLLRLAKEVAENRNVKNLGAYFMTVLKAHTTPTAKPIAAKPSALKRNGK